MQKSHGDQGEKQKKRKKSSRNVQLYQKGTLKKKGATGRVQKTPGSGERICPGKFPFDQKKFLAEVDLRERWEGKCSIRRKKEKSLEEKAKRARIGGSRRKT